MDECKSLCTGRAAAPRWCGRHGRCATATPPPSPPPPLPAPAAAVIAEQPLIPCTGTQSRAAAAVASELLAARTGKL